MSDPVITSEEEYKRNETLMDETETRIRKQGLEEKWSYDRTEAALVEALLPYYKAKTDPASPVAARLWREDLLDAEGTDAMVMDPVEYPQLAAIISEQNRLMNAFHGTNWAAPPMIIIDGFSDVANSPMQFNRDAILIDKEYFDTHCNDPALAGGIAHEMAHRYQRSDTQLRIEVRLNILNHDPTDQDKAFARVGEAEADFNARRVTTKGVMTSFMKDLYADDALTLGHYATSHPDTPPDDLKLDFVLLPKKQREQWRKDAGLLVGPERDAAFSAGVQILDDSNSDDTHPKIRDRIRLQEALDKNDAILTCRNVNITEAATVLDASDCGRKHVPLIIDGLPTGEKLRR